MKALTYILSVYLLLLSVVPCCAFDNCGGNESPVTQTTDHNDNTKKDCGACSPFFNCEGCASALIGVPSLNFTFLTPEAKTVYTDFIFSDIPDAHYDFWRPPKVI